MKRTLLGLALLLPALCFAGVTNPSTKAATGKAQIEKKAEAAMAKEINLTGGTDANRMEIEKLAKEAGAEQASFDSTTGILKIHAAKNFNEAKFVSSVEKTLPGVTLKK